jgi:ABC-type protease/lipase transport system fused ATPase/permease subunit
MPAFGRHIWNILQRCARQAAARRGGIEMIARLLGGFLDGVSERVRNLSAGQRQLVALACAC